MTIGGNMSDSLAPAALAEAKGEPRKYVLRHLNGVRIIAALWVVAYHYQPQIYGLLPELKFLSTLTGAGYLAVDLFFVLSGFIICYQYLGRFTRPTWRGYGSFLVKRLARIYPAHLTVLLALAALVIGSSAIGTKVSDPDSYSVSGFFMDLFLLRSWVGDSQGWNIPAWSLSAEWLAYALYPAIALGAVWLSSKRPSTLFFAAGLIVILEGVATWIYPSSHMPVPAARILLAFSLGCLVYLASKKFPHGQLAGWLGALALIALLIVPALIPIGGIRASVALLLSALVILLLATGSGRPVRALGSKTMNTGGLISFSLYLAHVPALMILVRLLPVERFDDGSLPVRAGVAALYLVLAVVAGSILYRLVEKPAHRLIVSAYEKRAGQDLDNAAVRVSLRG
ncbi:acyltransferase [Arthrobacter oryzae]|uniref:acyltransferase family protein n=1 Tax=Arthrobacter oryzae TaxID=409290 RepID=UPI00285DE9E6|nr:acyltransferase [Arthrobacter oryzae]MDR6505111.1 peptidoglycan/LPS O-acetylase OafA/YrhL [Arthrobacter oryzae]